MGQLWHAYFYADKNNNGAPSRTATIEAEDEASAARIAVGQMERAARVEIVRPIWFGQHPTIRISKASKIGARSDS